MDDPELLERLTAVIAQAWREGCPVAGAARRSELAATAVRRWRSFARRHDPKHPSLDNQIEDLARGLRDCLEGDRRLVGRLMEDYRYLARTLAATLVEQERVDGP